MKNLLKKTMACSLIAVITNSVLASEIKLQAVSRYKQNEVMDKFAHDARAFEQYAALGKESCYSQLFAFNRIKRTDEIPYYFYSSMYNEGDPFVHILPIKSISDSLLAYDDEQKVTDKILKRGVITYSEYYAEMKKCDAKFDVTNDALHEAYLKLVTVPKNYDDTSYSEYDIDLDRGYRDDFLERYFIHKDVDGCPNWVCH